MKCSSRKIWLAAGGFFVLLLCCVCILYQSRDKNKEGRRPYKIGTIYMTMNNPYFTVVNEEIKAVVKEHGDVLITRDSVMDNEIQNRQISELIREGVDLLIINAVDWKGVSAGLKEAKEAGIPVLAVDAEVYDNSLVEGTVTSDNYTAGKLCARNLMRLRKEADILLLVQSENKSALDRIEGFKDTLDSVNWPYHIVKELECKGQLEVAAPLVEETLEETGEIDVVMALNDPSALGAMAALDAKDLLDQVLVYGIDGAPEAKNMIKNGRMTATVAQSPIKVGTTTAKLLYQVLDGEEIPDTTVIPVEEVTAGNIDDYSLNGWQ